VDSWKGTIQVGADFLNHIVPILGEANTNLVEGGRSFGGANTTGTGIFTGYTQESANEEGLKPFVVDDIAWWVGTDRMSKKQDNRLQRILRKGNDVYSAVLQRIVIC
jgi:hypothetical protein